MAKLKITKNSAARKAIPQVFKLSTQAGRIGLLCGVAAKTVTDEELQHAIVAETEKRPRTKPVVVPCDGDEVRFWSITLAASYLLRVENRVIPEGINYKKKLDCIQHRIARYCNADNVPHYYWAE